MKNLLNRKRISLVAFVMAISLAILLTLFMPKGIAFAQAADHGFSAESKIYTRATLKDDFTDDKVIIVLNREITRRFKEYSAEDFSEIDCVAVYDLTSATVQWTEREIAKRNSASEKMLVDIDSFRRILSLELREKSKENVLSAIRLLEARSDIISAEPNYTFEPPSNYPNNQAFKSLLLIISISPIFNSLLKL